MATFEAFTTEDWSTWLYHFVFGVPIPPAVPSLEQEPQIALRDLFNSLSPKARFLFAKATVRTFESIQPEPYTTEALFVLIQLLSFVCSPISRDIIRQRLASCAFEGYTFANHDLVELLVQAAAEQGVDDDLVEILERLVANASRRRVLTCLRAASKRGNGTYVKFLRPLFQMLRTSADVRAICEQLTQCFARTGYRHFFLWLTEDYPQLPDANPASMDLFECGLLNGPLKWPEPNGSLDSYRLLASGWISAGRRHFSAFDVFRLANQIRNAPEEHVTSVLRKVWLKSEKPYAWCVIRPSRYIWSRSSNLSEANQVFRITTDSADARTFPVALNGREEELLIAVSHGSTKRRFSA